MLLTPSAAGTPQTIQELFRKQRSLMLLLEEMNDGVLIADDHGRVVHFNETLRHLLHLSPAVLNRPCLDVVPSDCLHEALQAVIQTGQSDTLELSPEKDGLNKYFQVHLVPLVVSEGVTGCVMIFQDMTAIRRTEKMRRDFVANVSHELRTPLSAINGYAETLLEGALEDRAVALEFVQVIFRHSQRLSQLVSDLLDLSKLESMDFEPELASLSLGPLVEKVHTAMTEGSAQNKPLSFTLDVPDDLPEVLANTTNLEQVLTNLMDNAVKYTPAGGKITVSARLRGDGMVQVNVADTGIGVAPKHISRLFERFYRVDKARSREMGGTGLGLSIVKHIVQNHGGEIWVESALHKGSTFSFTLRQVRQAGS